MKRFRRFSYRRTDGQTDRQEGDDMMRMMDDGWMAEMRDHLCTFSIPITGDYTYLGRHLRITYKYLISRAE